MAWTGETVPVWERHSVFGPFKQW